ncbi:MAG: hypothetical protein IT385_02705 [Deltaproteobacteria bacterium]|nr:hypothetical protein [Deltaproteobacteria bacterium]
MGTQVKPGDDKVAERAETDPKAAEPPREPRGALISGGWGVAGWGMVATPKAPKVEGTHDE